MLLDVRHLVHPHHRLAVEIAFLDDPVFECDRAEQRGKRGKADPAFHLRRDPIGRDGEPAVDHGDDAVHHGAFTLQTDPTT